uniref:Uncharacterized protein n=1 Tax=Ditylenchus dipsaci TaxID=166011 RepID=A0A915DTR9_9BILA
MCVLSLSYICSGWWLDGPRLPTTTSIPSPFSDMNINSASDSMDSQTSQEVQSITSNPLSLASTVNAPKCVSPLTTNTSARRLREADGRRNGLSVLERRRTSAVCPTELNGRKVLDLHKGNSQNSSVPLVPTTHMLDSMENSRRGRALTTTNSNFSGIRVSTAKRKYSSFELASSSSPPVYCQPLQPASLQRNLPTFVSNVPELVSNAPTPRMLMMAPLTTEFATPTHHAKKPSRPSSPSVSMRQCAVLSKSRIATICRESDCSVENEAAHEKLVKNSQQVSMNFEDFCLDEKQYEERKRAKSLTEPISIFTNAFLPQSSSPSPTRIVDTQKQCYSPSTQQVVRSNISYSPSPSPTPSSPTRNRIMRRYTGSANGSTGGMESDGESSLSGYVVPIKRHCGGTSTPRSAASPLMRDPLSSTQPVILPIEVVATTDLRASSPIALVARKSPLLLDLNSQYYNSPCSLDLEENSSQMAEGEDVLPNTYRSFCSSSFNDNNSSTTFSSRAGTPNAMEEAMNETVI